MPVENTFDTKEASVINETPDLLLDGVNGQQNTPPAPGSPRSVEGFVTSVELNTPEESYNTNLPINQSSDLFPSNIVEQSSGPFSVYVSSSPEPVSLDPPPQSTSEMEVETPAPAPDFEAPRKSEVEPTVEIVHAQSTVEVVTPPSPVSLTETNFNMDAIPSETQFDNQDPFTTTTGHRSPDPFAMDNAMNEQNGISNEDNSPVENNFDNMPEFAPAPVMSEEKNFMPSVDIQGVSDLINTAAPLDEFGLQTGQVTESPLNSNPMSPVQAAPMSPVQAPMSPVQAAPMSPVQAPMSPVQAAPMSPVQAPMSPVQAAPMSPEQAPMSPVQAESNNSNPIDPLFAIVNSHVVNDLMTSSLSGDAMFNAAFNPESVQNVNGTNDDDADKPCEFTVIESELKAEAPSRIFLTDQSPSEDKSFIPDLIQTNTENGFIEKPQEITNGVDVQIDSDVSPSEEVLKLNAVNQLSAETIQMNGSTTPEIISPDVIPEKVESKPTTKTEKPAGKTPTSTKKSTKPTPGKTTTAKTLTDKSTPKRTDDKKPTKPGVKAAPTKTAAPKPAAKTAAPRSTLTKTTPASKTTTTATTKPTTKPTTSTTRTAPKPTTTAKPRPPTSTTTKTATTTKSTLSSTTKSATSTAKRPSPSPAPRQTKPTTTKSTDTAKKPTTAPIKRPTSAKTETTTKTTTKPSRPASSSTAAKSTLASKAPTRPRPGTAEKEVKNTANKILSSTRTSAASKNSTVGSKTTTTTKTITKTTTGSRNTKPSTTLTKTKTTTKSSTTKTSKLYFL